jgi:spore maturation protein CgeB
VKIVIFGLTVSSSWGNGHATLWRGLLRALGRRGHDVVFFERDVPYYASHRDLDRPEGGRLVLYREWSDAQAASRRALEGADVGIVTSYCPDACDATVLLQDARVPLLVFYDLDTPVTLERLRAGEPVSYLGPERLTPYDLVLSFTGGVALTELTRCLGARHVVPLYGSVDPEVHRPVEPERRFHADLSYLGTYAADRRLAMERLFLDPARSLPHSRFLLGGSLYPEGIALAENVSLIDHVPPREHAAFFASSRLTLNLTRASMAALGHCPSGRLFEAAACGAAMVSDRWEGLERFFEPGSEILIADDADDVRAALARAESELRSIGARARARVLAEHTAARRAVELIAALEGHAPREAH